MMVEEHMDFLFNTLGVIMSLLPVSSEGTLAFFYFSWSFRLYVCPSVRPSVPLQLFTLFFKRLRNDMNLLNSYNMSNNRSSLLL